MIKPFTVHIEKSNTEDFIKPFTVGGDHVQVKEQEPQTGNNEKQTKTSKYNQSDRCSFGEGTYDNR